MFSVHFEGGEREATKKSSQYFDDYFRILVVNISRWRI